MKKLLLIALCALALTGISSSFAYAAAAPCDLSSQLNAVNDAKKKSDASPDAIKTELQARKDALGSAITCSLSNATTLRDTVKGLQTKDTDIASIRDNAVKQLNDAIDFYNTQNSSIGTLGLKGSKDLAKNLLTWRANNYGPLADETGNLILWVNDQPLMGTAQNRLNQIRDTVQSLKLLDQDDVKKLFDDAQTNLTDAMQKNAAAKSALLEGVPPQEATLTIKNSLEALAKTYQSFFDLGDAVKKLLPI